MQHIQKELARAFELLQQISVRGGDVEVMAMAKAALANAHRMLKEQAKEQAEGDTEHGK